MTLSRDRWSGPVGGVHAPERPKNRGRPHDRVSVVAKKRGKARGAKGHRNGRSVSNKDSENKSATVPRWVKQAEEALEKGVKGGKWFSLIDKVWNLDTISTGRMPTLTNSGFTVW